MINRIKSFIGQPYVYSSLLLLAILLIFVTALFYQFDKSIFSTVSLDSSRYLLSAMAQAQAAILAIVVGFSFVAFQLSAQVGSPRVFDLFLKSMAFWGLLIIYGLSIFYDLVLLRILTETTVGLLVTWINVSVFLAFISFISLFPYAYRTIDQLKPERIIQGIIKIRNGDVESLKRDTILPIVDITNKAIRANDPHTLKVGLEELEKLNSDIIDLKIDSKNKLEIVKYYADKTSRLVETAIIEKDESSVIEITESLGKIGRKAIESRWNEVHEAEVAKIKSDERYRRGGVGLLDRTDNYDNIASEIKNILSDASNRVIERKWERATRSVLHVRGSLLVKSQEELVLESRYDISGIYNDFLRLSDEEKIFSMTYFMETVRNILIEFIKKDTYFDDREYKTIIRGILENSLRVIDKNDCFKISKMINHITDIGIEAAKKNHKLQDDAKEYFKIVATSEKCPSAPIFEIGNRGFGTAIDSKKIETLWICSCLKEIGISCISTNLDEPTSNIFTFLEGIEGNYRNRKTDDVLEVTEKITEIIEELGHKSIENKLEKSSREAISSLIGMGMMIENNELKKRICGVIDKMREKLENKDIFNFVMSIYEKKEKYKLTKFQEFRRFCGF